jgi:hypothetical protein
MRVSRRQATDTDTELPRRSHHRGHHEIVEFREEIARSRLRGVPVQLGTRRLNRALNFYLRLRFRGIGHTESHILQEAR